MKTDKLGESLFASLEENIKLFESLGDEFRFQAKSTLTAQLERMDLVSREEFDATRASLDRAITKIKELEEKLAQQ